MEVSFGVLGAVAAWDGDGAEIALKGPRHRAVLARLLAADGRVVPLDRLVDDLWPTGPPPGAIGAVRTFVGALRRALEPARPPRTPPSLLVTEGPGYALRVDADAVDARRFERALRDADAMLRADDADGGASSAESGASVADRGADAVRRGAADADRGAADARRGAADADRGAADALALLDAALGWWRGPAYAGLDEPWAATERGRLAELRLHVVERRAAALLALGRAAEAVPDLDVHVAEHPWREEGWRLLALALYRSGRQADALAVLRRARELLVDQLAIEPGPALRALEHDILVQHERLAPPDGAAGAAGAAAGAPEAHAASAAGDPIERVWSETAAAYDRAAGARARLESTVGLLRDLTVTGGGGLLAARRQRVAAVAAAEELDDPELTARVIGAYDVPASWTRVDDPAQAAAVVAAAERTLARLSRAAPRPAPETPAADRARDALRARLLATVAVESRGAGSARAAEAAREAEALARRLGDPALLAFALNGRWMQCFERSGLAPERDAIGAELVALAERHGLASHAVLGHLIRMQARAALADFDAADEHAAAVDRLAAHHDRPLAGRFTTWYRALRLAATGASAPESSAAAAEAAYRAAAASLDDAGMPGLSRGLLALALLCLRVARGEAAPTDPALDWGPYLPWARPLVLLARGDRAGARTALDAVPEPRPDLLLEATWCLLAQAALQLGDDELAGRARRALAPARDELAGAGSGLLTAGPVAAHLAALDAALGGAASS